METRFDDLLYNIISEKGQGIYGFFDVMMGFMYRKTDFFYEMAPGENMGFFPGQAEALLYNYFRKYQAIHFKERVPKRQIDPEDIKKFIESQKSGKQDKEKVQEKKDNTSQIRQSNQLSQPNKSDQLDKIETECKINIDKEIVKSDKDKPSSEVPKNENQIQQTQKFVPISTYNGDSCDQYFWSQGTTEVEIQIKLPIQTGAKQVSF